MALSFSALQQGVNPVVTPDRTKSVRALAEAQAMQQQGELRGLQIEGARGELDAQKQAQAKAAKVFEILSSSQGQVTPEVINAIRPIDHAFASALEKSESDKANVAADNKREDDQNYLEQRQQEWSRLRQNEVDSRAMEAAQVPKTEKYNPGDLVIRRDAKGNEIGREQVPFAPKVDQSAQTVTTADGIFVLNADGTRGNKLGDRPPSQSTTSEPLVPVDDGNGNITYVPRSQAAGQRVPVSSSNKPSTGVEKRVLTFYIRAKDADENVKTMEPQIQKISTAGQVGMQWLPNMLQSELGQNYRQAQRAFTEARLRKDSGAAIPPHEYTNDARTYFAVPGDSAKVLEQKRKARASIMEGLKQESGRAYKEHYGEDNTGGGGAVEEYERGPDGKLRLKAK